MPIDDDLQTIVHVYRESGGKLSRISWRKTNRYSEEKRASAWSAANYRERRFDGKPCVPSAGLQIPCDEKEHPLVFGAFPIRVSDGEQQWFLSGYKTRPRVWTQHPGKFFAPLLKGGSGWQGGSWDKPNQSMLTSAIKTYDRDLWYRMHRWAGDTRAGVPSGNRPWGPERPAMEPLEVFLPADKAYQHDRGPGGGDKRVTCAKDPKSSGKCRLERIDLRPGHVKRHNPDKPPGYGFVFDSVKVRGTDFGGSLPHGRMVKSYVPMVCIEARFRCVPAWKRPGHTRTIPDPLSGESDDEYQQRIEETVVLKNPWSLTRNEPPTRSHDEFRKKGGHNGLVQLPFVSHMEQQDDDSVGRHLAGTLHVGIDLRCDSRGLDSSSPDQMESGLMERAKRIAEWSRLSAEAKQEADVHWIRAEYYEMTRRSDGGPP